MAGDLDVVEHGQFLEEPDVLERAGNAEGGDLMRLEAVTIAAVKGDPAGRDRRHAGQQVEDRRLARPVRADQTDQFTRSIWRSTAETATRPPKCLGQLIGFEQHCPAHLPLPSSHVRSQILDAHQAPGQEDHQGHQE